MDQRWADLIERIHREHLAEVIFRFPSQPQRAMGVIVLSPEPGTDVGELARRVAEFLRPTGRGCVCFPNAVSSSVACGESEGSAWPEAGCEPADDRQSADGDESRLGAQGKEVKEV
jgi:hypothetical protein